MRRLSPQGQPVTTEPEESTGMRFGRRRPPVTTVVFVCHGLLLQVKTESCLQPFAVALP